MLELLIGLLFSFSPLFELRGAIPLIMDYCISEGISYIPFVALAIVFNILAIFIAFFFLEYLHHRLLKWKRYKHLWHHWLHTHLHRHMAKIEKSHHWGQYFALLLFVALPIPGTGVWASTTIAWLLGLDKKKSFMTIALGAISAGLIIFFVTLSLFAPQLIG
jgi:uncharacterized membrane protein